MSLKIKIDVENIAAQCKEFAIEAQQDLMKGVENLAAITHAKVVEMAAQELHTSREKFMENLGFEEISEGIWVVSVDEDAFWIEEGLKDGFDMKPGLLKNAKTSKDGKRYKVVPFEHSQTPSNLTASAQSIVSQIKSNLRKEKVPFKKIEKDSWDRPKVGKLHSFNWASDVPGRGNTPSLKGVSIYQTMTKGGNVRRDILTFRTVTENQPDKWISPGFEAKHFLDRAMEWALNEWEQKILPEIMSKWQD